MKKLLWLGAVLLLSTITADAQAKPAAAEWEIIPVDTQMEITDDQGTIKTINPSCAFDTVLNPINGEPLDNAFHFYFKQGKSKNLLVYFNGGGACWNDATCVASLALAGVPAARPAYNPSILTDNSPLNAGGIFNDSEKDNPFKDWSKVFIPYCTGDIHVGSSDVVYLDVDGSITGYPGAPVTVKHRGSDNFMAVTAWLKQHFDKKKQKKVKKLLVTGSSAGGYGATLHFPHLQAAFPKADSALFADASSAVVTQGFIDSVFDFNKVWNVEANLPLLFSEGLTTYSALGFNNEIFSRLSEAYPNSRFAQYTTQLDWVQVQFLKIMDQNDLGNSNPFTWGINEYDYMYFAEWNARMEASLTFLAETTNNYQHYIGSGNIHTILTDDFATPEVPHPFYQEQSAANVKFTKWLARFTKNGKFKPHSVKYSD
ncbi:MULTISPECIES: pectin acetylesterase-family hydrolase [unclassified Arsukibacterium]|uniref:pectin acetylesterase-family hydrolase n=1 Tax=unclassified Arsukibacterium TaxID=2635278 RepID=UPI000C476A43|nr:MULTISPECIES: pectin acetylesterase-family hydrolase [unclassified Arsukibacterium]MAA96078.1 hypothetical protein [Rheinheimera sp.]MBM32914.1 hypothetical protein [Rheinheimera sp.]HAW91602.1 hypothetical protein [Candidatus Azambacteria bacterium]|tara:strand:- start:103278 stop:104561 length:1284 start_codon:yes stop_codon:yes gene_type:complete